MARWTLEEERLKQEHLKRNRAATGEAAPEAKLGAGPPENKSGVTAGVGITKPKRATRKPAASRKKGGSKK